MPDAALGAQPCDLPDSRGGGGGGRRGRGRERRPRHSALAIRLGLFWSCFE